MPLLEFPRNKYELSIAFFILANKINDAIGISINKLRDLNLAILIWRLVAGMNSKATLDLIDLYLIEDGKLMEDPWLVSIGYWWKWEYFEAINTLSSMISETKLNLSKKIFNKGAIFSLYKENAVYKIEKTELKSQR